ncbi:MAG: hypothetical protein ACXWUB_08290 [Burkholderiales bacterium]
MTPPCLFNSASILVYGTIGGSIAEVIRRATEVLGDAPHPQTPWATRRPPMEHVTRDASWVTP